MGTGKLKNINAVLKVAILNIYQITMFQAISVIV